MKKEIKGKDTSWEGVSKWYDNLLGKDDTYQSKVILPNILRIVDPKPGKHIVELGSGQGFFSESFAKMGASVIGLDASRSLIKLASERIEKESYGKSTLFIHGDASDAFAVAGKTADALVIILALQNMKNLDAVSKEIHRIMKDDGKAVIVLNHPAFRVPKESDWGFDEKRGEQYRKVYKYLSSFAVDIDMNPGEKRENKKVMTKSFHRSLQDYTKAFAKAGLAISKIEEWISHKESQKGPRQKAEDASRKEIPIFMCLELVKITK